MKNVLFILPLFALSFFGCEDNSKKGHMNNKTHCSGQDCKHTDGSEEFQN